MSFGKVLEFKFEKISEKSVAEKYFNIEYIDSRKCIIYYSIIGVKELRKIKLLLLKNDEISVIIQKILDSSIDTDISDLMQRKLSAEIAEGIDREIIKNLQNYIDEKIT